MTTTELIKILKKYEHGGATGQSREISFEIPAFGFLAEPEITVNSTGVGIVGAQITLLLSGGSLYKEESEE